MPEHSTYLLLDLVGRKHACLAQIRELGLRQRELIETGDMTRLLNLLAVKQRALGELQDLERDLNPFRTDDPAQRVWKSETERLRCASLAEQSTLLLAEVLEVEKQCEESLRRRRDEAAEQLAVVQSAGVAQGAYGRADVALQTSSIDLTSGT